jgi:integrase
MPRQPSVRYFDSRKAYYCQYQGKQHLLASGLKDEPGGPTYLAALTAFAQLMKSGQIEKAKDDNEIQAILEKYMQHAQTRLRPSTFRRRFFSLRPFQQALGSLPVSALTHFKIEDFIAAQRRPRYHGNRERKWGDGAIVNFLSAANAAFNWARKRKLITTNPLEGFEGPKIRSRSRDCLVSPEDHQRILKMCRTSAFRRLVIALENTGARPGELVAAKTTDWDDAAGAIVYFGDDTRRTEEFRHKNAKHKDRVINFTGEALEMVRELVKSRPAGSVLFPTSRGKPYAKNSVANNFDFLRKRLGMTALTAYSYRHTFATNWLLDGKPVEILAELLGNSPQVIYKHYSHLCRNQKAIRAQLEAFKQGQKPCTPAPCPSDPDVSSQSA